MSDHVHCFACSDFETEVMQFYIFMKDRRGFIVSFLPALGAIWAPLMTIRSFRVPNRCRGVCANGWIGISWFALTQSWYVGLRC